MDRKIKFRVWLVKEKKYAYPLEGLQLTGRNGAQYCWLEQDLSNFKNADYSGDVRCTIQQFTGVTDCNSKEIFEGDIIKVLPDDIAVLLGGSPMYSRGEIKWLCEAWKVCEQKIGAVHLGDYVHCECCNAHLEVIGNIFENPELTVDKSPSLKQH